MKKMPCLFVRDFTDKRRPKISEQVTPGCEWVLAGEGIATRKWDGTACLVRAGQLYKRYDAKRGKPAPEGFEAVGDADPVTGHWPGWVPVNVDNPESGDVWHALAWWQQKAACGTEPYVHDGTYELCGPRINGNAEGLGVHGFIRHGEAPIGSLTGAGGLRSFDLVKSFLEDASIEGIVFWCDPANPDCDKVKIRRDDFGFDWPVKK